MEFVGFGKRFEAFLIDLLVIAVMGIVLFFALSYLGSFLPTSIDPALLFYYIPAYALVPLATIFQNAFGGSGGGYGSGIVAAGLFFIALIAYGILSLLTEVVVILGLPYFILFECSSWQATPGKKALGLKVTKLDGSRLAPLDSVKRYIGRIFCTFSLGLGYLLIFFDSNKQGLHDKIAGTSVVKA